MQLKQLWRRLSGSGVESKVSRASVSQDVPENSQSRALLWLGKDRLEREYFYEQWACHDTWKVYDEGIPLLLGRDPDDPELVHDTAFTSERETLWKHIQRCVERNVSPQLTNPADMPASWLAQPVELYRWAIAARLDVPEELDRLLSFISMTVKSSDENATGKEQDETDNPGYTQYLQREQVLTAMLAISLQAYHKSSNERVDEIREQILSSIYARSERLFGQEEPPLSRPALHDLIDRSLEMTGLIRVPG